MVLIDQRWLEAKLHTRKVSAGSRLTVSWRTSASQETHRCALRGCRTTLPTSSSNYSPRTVGFSAFGVSSGCHLPSPPAPPFCPWQSCDGGACLTPSQGLPHPPLAPSYPSGGCPQAEKLALTLALTGWGQIQARALVPSRQDATSGSGGASRAGKQASWDDNLLG